MPKLTDEQIARAYGYAAALQDRGGVDGQVGTAFLEVMQAYVEQRDALAQARQGGIRNKFHEGYCDKRPLPDIRIGHAEFRRFNNLRIKQ